MRVAQLIPSLQIGGAEKLQVTFAAAAQTRGLDLTVLSLRRPHRTPIPGELEALGARVVSFNLRRLLDPVGIARIVDFLRRERPDVLHTHLGYATIVGSLAGWLTHTPVVASLHSSGFFANHRYMIHHLETLALRYGVQRVVAVGHVVAEAHRTRLGGTPVVVIPNAVAIPPALPPAERLALRSEITGDPASPLLLAVGRLVWEKGFADLLTAFASIRQAHPSARLAIAGSGPLHAELRAQIEALGLGGHAELLGTRNDVPRLLAASDLFVSSSHLEGLPLAVLEAMAAGLPVVATAVGDVPRVVVPGTGVVVPSRDPAAIAAAVQQLLDDPMRMRALGTGARAYVTRNYSPSAWIDRLLAIYDEVALQVTGTPQPSGGTQ